MKTETPPARFESSVRSTLLHRPPAGPHALERKNLITLLDSGLDGAGTLVAAPAGYGKSVLISQWCERTDRPAVWISLATPVDGLRNFLQYLSVAVQTVWRGSMRQTSLLADGGSEPVEESAITALSNDLNDLPEQLLVVLDDFHVIGSPPVHRLVLAMLQHPARTAHFVIITRRDPPWPIASLRSRGKLNELRMAELRFNSEQSAEFLASEIGRELTEREQLALESSTEGWAAGLQLAVHAVRHGVSTDTVFGAGYLDRGAQEYLVAEVLDGLPADALRYLVAASYFDRFSAELCDATVGRAEGPPSMTGTEFIEWLVTENLFIIPLDDHGDWFRFHHVFALLLSSWRTSRGAAFEQNEVELHRRAAEVLRNHGMVEEAIGELARAGDTTQLVAVAAEHGNRLVNADRWGDLATLLGSIPAELFELEPALLLLRAWLVGEHGGRYIELVELLGRAKRLLDGGPGLDDLRGQLAVLRGTYVSLNTGDFDAALAEALTAQRLLREPGGRNLVFAYALGAMALANTGRYGEAQRLVDSVVGSERFVDWPMDPMIWVRPMLAWVEGSVETLERGGNQLIAAGERLEHQALLAYGHYFAGVGAYERNELALAEAHLSKSIDIDFVIVEVLLHSSACLALTRSAMGRPDDALRTGEAMLQTMLDTRGDYNLPTAQAVVALLDHRCGRRPAALRWARATEPEVPRHRYMFFDRTPTLIEILLSSPNHEAHGRELLDRALHSSYGTWNRPVNVKLLGLAAIEASHREDVAGACAHLALAVDRAHDGGLVRSLADLGTPLVPLLQRLDVSGPVLDHVGLILSAIDIGGAVPDHHPTVGAPASGASESGLTEREIDVLNLLAERYSNKEIARELLIAPATVKKHTVTLYEKLHVHGRREAVDKARVLGYITG